MSMSEDTLKKLASEMIKTFDQFDRLCKMFVFANKSFYDKAPPGIPWHTAEWGHERDLERFQCEVRQALFNDHSYYKEYYEWQNVEDYEYEEDEFTEQMKILELEELIKKFEADINKGE